MMVRPALEVADIIRAHGEAFVQSQGTSLCGVQRRALADLAACRTAELGGHVEACTGCGQVTIAYNSCRNRHCPKCQAGVRARWLERERSLLLPVAYHHVVFTLPHQLNPLVRSNPRACYGLLFRSVWATLREVASDPHYLGAELGVVAVLHTWGQTLSFHPHLHCVVTGGGLACSANGVVNESSEWVNCRPGFFLPVRVLSAVFRRHYLAGLRSLQATGQLRLGGRLAGLTETAAFEAWLQPATATDWVVHSKPPVHGDAEVVLKYLARYVHRVAIANSRLLALQAGQVTFTYKDYAQGGRHREMTLSAEEFLRRFVQHVLPRGFVKVRHYGLLSNRGRKGKLAHCQALLGEVQPNAEAASSSAEVTLAAPANHQCPQCGAALIILETWPRPHNAEPLALESAPLPAVSDTS